MGISGTQKALMYALGGKARGGATRGGYVNGRAYVTVAGVDLTASGQVEKGSVTVDDELNEVPNTCNLRVEGLAPARGDEVIITLGSKNRLTRLFAGPVVRPKTTHLFGNAAPGAAVGATDYTLRLHSILVTKHYVAMSLTDILLDLLTAAPGYSGVRIAAGLPVIDEVTMTNRPLDEAITQATGRVGADWSCDYHRVIHAFLEAEPQECNPRDLTIDHPTLSSFTYDEDDSQVANRCYVEGRGTAVLGAVAAGDTVIPVEAVDMFEAAGEFVKVAPPGSEGGAQHLTFTGVVQGGAGAIVGDEVSPSSAPTISAKLGSGITAGAHRYQHTFTTPSGETLPSPLSPSITHGTLISPTAAPVFISQGSIGGFGSVDPLQSGAWHTGDTVEIAYSYSIETPTIGSSTGLTPISPLLSVVAQLSPYYYHTPGDSAKSIEAQVPFSTDARIKSLWMWHRVNGGSWYLWSNLFISNLGAGTTTISLQSPGIYSAVATPQVSAPDYSQSTVTVPRGPNGTTGRKVYRTVAGGSSGKLAITLADNSTDTAIDSGSDGALGADAPTGDTSGLKNEIQNGESFYTNVTGFRTNGAATSATGSTPVFTSSSYTFVAADVGAYLYIKAGTNWLTGRYLITGISGSGAVLNRACATVGSPTAATFGVDYSGFATPRVQFTDLVIGATSTQFTSAANPVTVAMIGNVVAITDGIGFIRQRVIITDLTGAATAVCDKSVGTASSTGGTGNLGGAAPAVAVPPGATSMPMSNAGPFAAVGSGWALAGNQAIRYTGVSGNALTGIPASGPGAIAATIPYGQTVVVAPQLVGVPASGAGAIAEDLSSGEEVFLVVQEDDTAQQAILGARYTTAAYIDDGIRAIWVQDRRLSIAEARARGRAELGVAAVGILAIDYTVQDPNSRSGATVNVDLDLGVKHIVGAFRIQSVGIEDVAVNVDATDVVPPTYRVRASNQRFSLEDLIRQNRGRV